MANVTLGAFISPSRNFPSASKEMKKKITLKRIAEIDAFIKKNQNYIAQLQTEINRIIANPGAPNAGYVPITMTKAAQEAAMRASIKKIEIDIADAQAERRAQVKILTALGGTATSAPVAPVVAPVLTEASPVVISSSQPAQSQESGGGGMLLPVIAISGAALGTYLMFKG